jgi:hypothetical protein
VNSADFGDIVERLFPVESDDAGADDRSLDEPACL